MKDEFITGMVCGVGAGATIAIVAFGVMTIGPNPNWSYQRKCLVEKEGIYDPNLGTETCWTKDGRRIFIEGF